MPATSESTSPQTAPPPAPLRPPNTASALEEISARADTVWTRDHGQPIKIQAVQRDQLKGPHGRVAIVDGCRTPFVKSGTDFVNMDVVDLASVAVEGVLNAIVGVALFLFLDRLRERA